MNKKIPVLALLALVASIGVYGAVGQEISGTHTILGRGEVTCLKCHYDKYETMVSSAHGQDIVERIARVDYAALQTQPETYTCIACHGKRDRWDEFGMADWVTWYENSTAYGYAGEWWSLGYKQVAFPFGEGASATEVAVIWPTATPTYTPLPSPSPITYSATSNINITLITSPGLVIDAIIQFYNYTGNLQTTQTPAIGESPAASGRYTALISTLYPDYFNIRIRSSTAASATTFLVISDGTTTEVASPTKLSSTGAPLPYSLTTSYTYPGPLGAGATGYSRTSFPNNWNFHTGRYSRVTRMSQVWDNVRTIDEEEFPLRGIPIDYMGTVGEAKSCASTKGLCHATLKAITNAASGTYFRENRFSSGSSPYYEHSMTLSMDASQICGTCHAPMFAEGLSAHYGVQCYTCHSSHPAVPRASP